MRDETARRSGTGAAFLFAQASSEGLTILTTDGAIEQYHVPVLWA